MSIREQLTQLLSGKRVLVLGLGLQGGAKVANRLAELGAQVRVTDRKTENELAPAVAELQSSIERSLGRGNPADSEWADIIVKNPAVPFDHPLIQAAEAAGKIVTTEVALALRFGRDRVIGVTGTRGKTTTATLLWHILRQSGKNVEIGGNIPQRPALDVMLSAPEEARFVLEISSFQLEATHRERLSPHVGVITSLSPDHLNRYPSIEAYIETKASLLRWQHAGDLAVWWDQPEWNQQIERAIQSGVRRVRVDTATAEQVASWAPTLLPGKHNRHNVALAARVAESLGLDRDTIARAVANFPGVPYRQQIIPSRDGLTWINDTTATTPTALLTALEAQGDLPFLLITGGTTKQLPLPPELLQRLATLGERLVWLAGSGTQEAQAELGIQTASHALMAEAVHQARQLATQTGITRVLMSPGFSSFEHFTNEFDRGDQFNAAVQSPAPWPTP